MKAVRNGSLTLALALALAACGGGDGTNSTSSGSGGQAPGASASPSPSTAPEPPFGISAPFSFQIAAAVEYDVFTFTDRASPFPRTRLINARLIQNNENDFFSFNPTPEVAKLVFGGSSYEFTDADLSIASDYRSYLRDEARLTFGPIKSAGNEVMIVSHVWPSQPYTDNTQVGTTQKQVVGLIGNVSVAQSEIESGVDFSGQPDIYGNGLSIRKSTVSFTTKAVTDTGKGVNASFSLTRATDNVTEEAGAIRFLGTLDPKTNLFSGTIVEEANVGSAIGTFSGALYGPDRQWMGLVFQFSRAQDGGETIGWLLAPRAEYVTIPA